MREIVLSDRGPKPIGPYSQAIKVNGLLFVSGQVSIDPKTNEFVPGDIRQQTERTLENVRSVCCRISPGTNSFVFGSIETCPETKRSPFTLMAWEYGPIGFGPRSDKTISLMAWSP